ncbi:hypothetical protein VTN77DRAFT_51 [Rasamsonia byssochlamydoides]|uniref:uncharacterized protein n=1 Tax=Rasamsonia byssochlamydoides TaxID=89139 RepID=UPI0037422AEE
MPPITGIPTYTSAPINPNSPSKAGNARVTPVDVDQRASSTTTTDSSSSQYPPARPGAAAAPATTGATAAVASAPQSSAGTYPTTTAQGIDSSSFSTPPAPQPVARPIPGTAGNHLQSNVGKRPSAYTVPPPPKAGEPVQPASYYTPRPVAQAEPPPPTGASLSHTRNHPAFQTSSSAYSTSSPYTSAYQPPTANSNQTFASQSQRQYHAAGGEDEGEGSLGQGILDTAKSWMQIAGTKLAEAEAEVWRRVNSKT